MSRPPNLRPIDHFLGGGLALITSLNALRQDWLFVAIGAIGLAWYAALALGDRSAP